MASPSPPTDRTRTVALRQALNNSEPLALLLRRLQTSRAALQSVLPSLPAELHSAVQAGPWEENQGKCDWTLLAPNPAVAAKLRQCLPAMQESLRQFVAAEVTIRVKVLPRT